jgi:hypothetical protein
MDYAKRIEALIDQIECLTKELMLRNDKEVETVVDGYLRKIKRLKNKIKNLKIRHYQNGGLYS